MSTTLKALGGVVGIILAIVVIVALSVGAYGLHWWLREDSVNRNSQINQDSYQRQNALVEQIIDDIAEAEGNLPPAQRVAIIDQVCDSAAKLTGTIQLPPNAATFVAANC